MTKVILATRPYSWPASIIPVIVGSVVAFKYGVFSTFNFACTLMAALLVHSGANLANSYFDYKNGIDMPEHADDRTILDCMLTPGKTLKLSVIFIFISCIIGIYLTVKNRVPLMLALGLAGVFLGWFYTAGNIHYKYRALGEIGIFVSFGPLIVIGTVLIQTGKILPAAFLSSIPLGFLIVAILFANNMRDMHYDFKKNIKTLAQILGEDKSIYFYRVLIISAYCSTVFFWFLSRHDLQTVLPAVLFPLLSIPFAKKLFTHLNNRDFSSLVRDTAKFVGVFGILLATGLIFL
jgi:1,4-dihydroxy-2-naphthoate octaprenyltransferase